MTQNQKERCHEIIHTAAVAAGGIGLSPIPGSDIVPLVTVQTAMILALANVFDVSIEKSYAAALAKTAIASQFGKLAAGQLLKMIPGLGSVANGAVAFSVTELLGWDAAKELHEMSYERICA